MKNVVRSTYHFQRDEPASGSGPDEAGVRRTIRETVNLLSLLYGWTAPSDARAIRAVSGESAEGFTAAQLLRFRQIVESEINARRARHLGIGGHSDLVLADLASIEVRWNEADADLVRMIASAEEVVQTGLEPNSEERRAAEVPA